MRTFIGCLLVAAVAGAQQLPPLTHLNTGAPALGSGSGLTQFTFYVAGDNRPDSGSDLSEGFKALVKKMKNASPAPAFVLWGGDTIKGKDPDKAKKQSTLVLEKLGKLNVPVINVPGNHELNVKGPSDACHDAPDPTGKLLEKYVKHMGPAYGLFRYGNSAFIGINTDDSLGSVAAPACYNGFVNATQLAQLQAALTALQNDATVQNIFLFMHRPLHDDNSHQIGPAQGDQNTPYAAQLNAFITAVNALTSTKVSYVFASHDHRYYAAPSGAPGTPAFVISGGAGAPLSGCPKKGRAGAYYHWLQVGVNGSAVTVTVVPLTDTKPCGAPPP